MTHLFKLSFLFIFWLLVACIPTEHSHGNELADPPEISKVHEAEAAPATDNAPKIVDYSGVYLVEETEFDDDSLAKTITPYYVELRQDGTTRPIGKKIHNYENLGSKWNLTTSLSSSVLFVEGRYIVESPYSSSNLDSEQKKKLSGTLSTLTDTTLISNFDIIVSIKGTERDAYKGGAVTKSFYDEKRLKRKGIWHKIQ